MKLKYSVGTDVDSKILEVNLSVIDNQQEVTVICSRRFDNTASGHQQIIAWVEKNRKDKKLPVVFCMEASGVYHEKYALYLHEQGNRVSVILANKASQYLKMIGESKNDKLDAKGLARMGAEQNLRQWKPAPAFYLKLRDLTRFYEEVQDKRTSEISQQHSRSHSAYKDSWIMTRHKRAIEKHDKDLKQIKKRISNHLASDKEVQRKVSNICRLKGVGELTVAVLIAETFGFGLFENTPQLISYSGYDVIENQSGFRVGKTRISKKGNSHIRRALYFPAFNVVRDKQRAFVNLHARLSAKNGKLKMKTYVAIQNKLLITIFSMWKNDTVYDNDYHLNLDEYGAFKGTSSAKAKK